MKKMSVVGGSLPAVIRMYGRQDGGLRRLYHYELKISVAKRKFDVISDLTFYIKNSCLKTESNKSDT